MAIDETVRQHKFLLDESEMPTAWYNLVPDLPSPPPPALHPGTLEPAGPDDFAPLFPMDLILQEVSMDRYIDIPGAVLDVYRQWRPTPLFRAHRLEQALGTPARIYYKYEGGQPAGSHKPNTAVPQAYYNAKAGVKKLTTETGAGQWGTALAFACALFGLECEIWQVGASYDQKPYRRLMMETFGGGGAPLAQSTLTEAGRAFLAEPTPTTRARSASPSPRPSRWPRPTPRPATRWAACSTTCCCTRRSSARRRLLQLAKAGETAPTCWSAAPAAARTSAAWPSRSCARRWPARMDPIDPGRRAGVVPVADPGRLRLRLRRHGRHDPADEDAHPRPRLRPRPHPRRRAALPRHVPAASRTSTSWA